MELVEHTTHELRESELTESLGTAIWDRYRKYVELEFPSPRTGRRWRLTAKGYAGFLPVGADFGIAIQPKVPVSSIFRLLEHAYGLEGFRFFQGSFKCSSLEDVYTILASELARRALLRVRRGLLQAYEEQDERLPVIRGRFDVRDHIRQPWQPTFRCRFDTHTADVDENRLLAWALFVAARTIVSPETSRALVRKAYRAVRRTVDLVPMESSVCVNRAYDRLTRDYAQMHLLCAFVIDHAGPHHTAGDRSMLPFVVDMNRLFERFVCAALIAGSNAERTVVAQERIRPAGDDVAFVLDVLVRNADGKALRVIDTKYKDVTAPSADDIAQVVTYATAVGAGEAVLVYPRAVDWKAKVGPVRVRTMGFPIDGDPLTTADEIRAALL